jgi:hypothetical protein
MKKEEQLERFFTRKIKKKVSLLISRQFERPSDLILGKIFLGFPILSYWQHVGCVPYSQQSINEFVKEKPWEPLAWQHVSSHTIAHPSQPQQWLERGILFFRYHPWLEI